MITDGLAEVGLKPAWNSDNVLDLATFVALTRRG